MTQIFTLELTLFVFIIFFQQLKKAWVFPFLYAFSSFGVIFLVIIAYKSVIKYQAKLGHQIVPSTDKDCIKEEEEIEGLTGSSSNGSREEMQIVKTKKGRLLVSNYEKVRYYTKQY